MGKNSKVRFLGCPIFDTLLDFRALCVQNDKILNFTYFTTYFSLKCQKLGSLKHMFWDFNPLIDGNSSIFSQSGQKNWAEWAENWAAQNACFWISFRFLLGFLPKAHKLGRKIGKTKKFS